MTRQQRAVYLAVRRLGGELIVTADNARQLRALQRRGLIRYGRDANGNRVARSRIYGPARRKRNRHRKNIDLWLGRV